jgi:hypothetical protein
MAAALGLGVVTSASAGLLEPGQDIRVIPFLLRDVDKPMIEASVAGKKGLMLFDNGTPDALFLNRDALALPAGKFVARGYAASGQLITVHEHPTPAIKIDGQAVSLPEHVRSGDFAFTAPAFGDAYLGFIGTKMVENDAFLLDYARRHLVLLKTGKDGLLKRLPPQTADIVVTTRFMIWPGGQPSFATAIGAMPILTDIDTGDGGTLYVSAATRSQLIAQGKLQAHGKQWRLSGLTIAGVLFEPTPVRLVEVGGPEDLRSEGQLDQLRLGSAFLAANTCLWNFPAKTLTFLKPDSPFLAGLGARY